MPERLPDQKRFDELRHSGMPFVLHIGAEWCAPCAKVNELLDNSPVNVLKAYVDADALPHVVEALGIETVPTVLFFRDDSLESTSGTSVIASVSGAKLPLIDFHLNSLFGAKPRSDFPAMDEYLKHLTTRVPVVIFITGTVAQPRCGFTQKLIDMLTEIGVPYLYQDILEDEEMCQALKRFSDWPTYPQVYAGGRLIGGLDDCVALHSKGELAPRLQSAFPGASSQVQRDSSQPAAASSTNE